MMMAGTARTVLAFVLLVHIPSFDGLAMPAAIAAQRSQPAATTGAIISGTVVTDDGDARPIRRARVTLESGLLEIPRGIVTDDSGQFAFTALPAGNYTLSVTKAGYVTVAYGAKRAGERPGIAIAVRDGQRVAGLVLRVPRGGVLTGVVRQPNGQPAPNLNVTVTGIRTIGGQRRTTALDGGGGATTDDRGVYRVFGLAAGEYIVQVRARPMFAVMSGGGRRVTAEEIAWALQTPGRGSVTTAPMSSPPAPGPSVAYAPVFYPGTTDSTAASIVTVAAGQERDGLDFTIDYVPAARVSGTVVGPDGRPVPRAQLSLLSLADDPGNPLARLMGTFSVRYQPDGSFVADNVTPGRYELTARAAEGGEAPGPPMPMGGLFGGRAGGAMTLWAREEVDVNGRDVDVAIRLQPGMTLSGRVIVQATKETPPVMTSVNVSLSPVAAEGTSPELVMMAMFGGGGSSASVTADGTFEIKGVVPGRYRVTPIAPGMLPMIVPGVQIPQKWSVASIVAGGRDILDRPIEIRPNESLSGIVVTMTDRVTELSGTIYDQAGRPTPAFPIVVFPTDRGYWAPGSRRIQQARPASDGKFSLVGLPPGEYYLCAATDLDPNDLMDPLFLEQLIAGSFKIVIGVGEKKTQDVKLAGG
jgi:hypothetical protein